MVEWTHDYQQGHLGRLYDANGKELDYVTRCNVHTGVAEHLQYKDGRPVLNDSRDAVLREIRQHQAPLKFVPL